MKDKTVPLKDIVDSIDKIERFIEGVDFDSFCNNEMMFDAVIRNLEIIGEAARNTSEEIKGKYPEVPWRSMIGVRNILIHEYFGIDNQIIWEIIKKNLTEIKPVILRVIQEAGEII